ncbi:MAG: LON peptidase substrate-binding domain-containing protein [Chromatiales bacterium]|nr:LON peptidase substrate-binding domain-containing protein [Chromatiales bacterium]
MPVLPLRDVVVYPHMVIPLFVGREKSIHALEQAMQSRQADPAGRAEAAPTSTTRRRSDIYDVGTLADDPAAAEAAGRHGQGAGRGRRARRDRAAVTETETSSPPRSALLGDGEATTSARSTC